MGSFTTGFGITMGIVAALLVLIFGIPFLLAFYETHITTTPPPPPVGFSFEKSFSLNNTQNTASGQYPYLSDSWSVRLSSGSYRMTLHTSNTIGAAVCAATCPVPFQEYTSSESPPNVANFTINSISEGNYGVSISIGCLAGLGGYASYLCYSNSASGTISIVKV
jgi:hypothetical protein